MAASFFGKDSKSGNSSSMDKSTESWAHLINAGLHHIKSGNSSSMDESTESLAHSINAGLYHIKPNTKQQVSAVSNGKEVFPTVESNDHQSPQNATDPSSLQDIQRTEHSVAISDSTGHPSKDRSHITVQSLLIQEIPDIAPAHADDTALYPTIVPNDHPTKEIRPTHTLLSNGGSSALPLASMTPQTALRLVGSERELPGRLEDHSSVKPTSSDAELPLSLRRPRRPLMPTLKLKDSDSSPARKRKLTGGAPKAAAEKRQRTTQDLSTEQTRAYGTPRPTSKPIVHQSSSITTQSMTQSIPPMTILSIYQQNNTTLRVSVTTYIYASILPIKLQSCITMETFFYSILTATRDAVNRGNPSSDIMVSFCWKDATDNSRTMLLRKDTVDTFRVFLETIAEAPCWNQVNGKCEILVDVV